MIDQYIREYWGDPEQSDKLIQFYKEAHKQGRTKVGRVGSIDHPEGCLLYTSPSPRDRSLSRMPSSA